MDAPASPDGGQRALYVQKVEASTEAVRCGDYARAITLYTDALALDPHNYVLYSNRSATHVKLGQYTEALRDARKVREINNTWTKVSGGGMVMICCHGDDQLSG